MLPGSSSTSRMSGTPSALKSRSERTSPLVLVMAPQLRKVASRIVGGPPRLRYSASTSGYSLKTDGLSGTAGFARSGQVAGGRSTRVFIASLVAAAAAAAMACAVAVAMGLMSVISEGLRVTTAGLSSPEGVSSETETLPPGVAVAKLRVGGGASGRPGKPHASEAASRP